MKWISVKDKLPDKKGEYLCYIEAFEDSINYDGWYYYIDIVIFDKKIINTEYSDNRIVHLLSEEKDFAINRIGYESQKVTHWMPLPKPPKISIK